MRTLGRRLLQGLLVLTLLLPQVAQARQVRLELSVPEHRQGLSAAVDIWGFEGGERVWLRDDGELEGDIAGDGVLVGVYEPGGPEWLRESRHGHNMSLRIDGYERDFLVAVAEPEEDIHVHWTLRGAGEGTLSEPEVKRIDVRGQSQRPIQVAVAGGAVLVALGGLALRVRSR
ncbi:MAG: hypothetical protein VX899_19690 [Myxococcota bacterium]|nr:hypothetical protein [Myxococcota bacterium]